MPVGTLGLKGFFLGFYWEVTVALNAQSSVPQTLTGLEGMLGTTSQMMEEEMAVRAILLLAQQKKVRHFQINLYVFPIPGYEHTAWHIARVWLAQVLSTYLCGCGVESLQLWKRNPWFLSTDTHLGMQAVKVSEWLKLQYTWSGFVCDLCN